MNFRQTLKITQTLKLKQVLSPKLIQMLKRFHMPYEQLVQEIDTASKENVFVEVERQDQLLSYSHQGGSGGSFHGSGEGTDIADFAKAENQENLYDYLLNQLNLLYLPEKELKIATYLLENIDDQGYLTNFLSLETPTVRKKKLDPRKVTEILKIIQTLEPEGIGARNLKECLLIQIENHDFENEQLRTILEEIVKNHLDALGEQKYEKIAEKLEIEAEGVEAIHSFIKQNLDPTPGSKFNQSSLNQHIVPSFEVSMEEGNVKLINLEQKMGIKINLNQNYVKALEDPSLDEETKTFLKERLAKAKELIDNLERRYENIENIATLIISKQKLFVEKGVFFLNPLLQKEVAHELNINSSTVSRILSSKYIRTPHGTYLLKELCPRNHFGKTAPQLQYMIEQLIHEYPNHSDQKLSNLLKQEGINIARRTVTKYRLKSGVKSSYDRSISEE